MGEATGDFIFGFETGRVPSVAESSDFGVLEGFLGKEGGEAGPFPAELLPLTFGGRTILFTPFA
jgi:hypothetical protein